jgi:outer membrane receptor protein involved in Fe transport
MKDELGRPVHADSIGGRARMSLVVLAALVITSFFLTIAPACAHAQAVWGGINGYVTDSSGAVVSKAIVDVKDEDTGIETKIEADAAGFYNATHLTPGQYSVSVHMSGFEGFVREHLILPVAATIRVDCLLKVGASTETVTVTAAPPILNTEQTDVSDRFEAQSVDSLPLVGNNVTQLYALVPGVIPDTFQMGSGENPQGTDRTYVNGVWSGAQVYVLDGITDVDYGFSGIQVINPPPDSVQEVKVITADYDPEFGNTAGMVAQFVTKSGTNQIHGSVFEYNRNSATFASTPFTGGAATPPYNWNQGGFSLGAPVKKDKLFAFGDYQLSRLSAKSAIVTTVPIDDFRNGNFSSVAATHPIYDPTTGNPDGTGRTQFLNNTITNIDPVAQKLLKLLPEPNLGTPGQTDNNYTANAPQAFNTNEFDLRSDFSINPKDKMFGRYSYFHSYLDNPGIFGVEAGGPSGGGLSPEVANSLSQQAALNYTHTFGSSLLGEFRLGFDRFAISGYQADSALQTNTMVGIPNINTGDPKTGGLAGINIGGPVGIFYMGIPSGVGVPRFEGSTTGELVNNWTKLSGEHQILWGADIQRQDFNFLSVNASTRGNFTFPQTITGIPSDTNSGMGMATFLLGLPSEFDRAVLAQFPGERQTRIGVYAQDVWRATPRLTVNAGLRWDWFEPVKPAHPGGLANFDVNTGQILLAGLGTVSMSTNVVTPKDDFSPRLGLAYKLTEKTVVRAGFGQSFFSSGYDATFYHLTSFYPIIAQQTITASNNYVPIFPIEQTPVGPAPPALPSSGMLTPPTDELLKTRDPDFKTENMYSWNLTIERQLDSRTTLSVGYVGTKGTHLSFGKNINAAGPSSDTDLNDRRPFYAKFGISEAVNLQGNIANENYNGLVVKVNRHFSKYVGFSSNYTWSKTLGYYQYNPVDMKSNYGPGGNTNAYFEGDSGIDRASIWTAQYTILFPFGRGLKYGSGISPAANIILGGWQTSGVWSADSGLPFTPFVSSGATLNADFGQRADRVKGAPLYQNKSYDHWFNVAAFSIPPCCQYGDAGDGMLRGPHVFKPDLALWKGWQIEAPRLEPISIQFRAEAFNAFNHVNAGIPNNNIDNPAAGQITSLQSGIPMRQLQFGLHLNW